MQDAVCLIYSEFVKSFFILRCPPPLFSKAAAGNHPWR